MVVAVPIMMPQSGSWFSADDLVTVKPARLVGVAA